MGKCYNSTVIEAPLERVWEALRDFHNMDWAQPVVTEVEAVSDGSGIEVGARRLVSGVFSEELLAIDSEIYSFSYQLADGPSPISKEQVEDYIATVTLYRVTDKTHCFVEYRVDYRCDNEQEVAEFCTPVYIALLAALKANLEA